MAYRSPKRRLPATLATAFMPGILLSGSMALAQATNTGTIVGTVTDASGAVVKDAKVTVKDSVTNAVRETTTNGSGQYVLVNVTPSHYTITVKKDGFASAEITDEAVQVGTQTTASVQLTVGAAETTVEVQATGADLQTLNSTIGNTVSGKQIETLPNISREVSTFATLQPAVTPGGSVAGTVSDQATFQLDGGNNTSDMDGSMQSYTGAFGNNPTGVTALGGGASGVMPMPADSVEEFKVNTVNQTADFNNASGSQVAVVTKRGGNQFHGTAYEYYLDSNIGANTWDNNRTGTKKASYHYNRLGASAGGPILPNLFGGKTYLFGNYEGFFYPNAATYERVVPSANMRNGIVTFAGTTYNLAAIDPRRIGVNAVVQKMWNTYMPAGNDTSCGPLLGDYCDGVNEVGFKSNVTVPQKSQFGVARLDHDFGSKWHFMSSYRYYNLQKTTSNQVDIGGFFAGDTLGVPKALSKRPQTPWYFVTQLTTNLTNNTTNDFHYSYLRNSWSWQTNNAPPQASGLGGALEPFGENQTSSSPLIGLTPFNVDTSNIRARLWDGQDHFLRDDVTMLKGNHLIQFGGEYQHNWDYHQRTDNGNGINFTPTYQLGDATGAGQVNLAGLLAAGYPSSVAASRVAAATLGIVTDSQVTYTRAGASLALNPALTPAQDYVTTPFYNVYFSDTWHMKPSVTVNYGMGWALEMPPTEATGKQVVLVDGADEPVKALDYMTQKKNYAQQGQVYNPQIGFALVGNVGSGRKYPFNPYYGQFSPRISVAWSPDFGKAGWFGHAFGGNATVIRAGYGRVYGRLNGVGMVLLPLLGPGLLQPVQCQLALASGACGPATPTDTTAFRIGTDGNAAPLPAASATLPQPLFPGYNQIGSATASTFDPNYRPNSVDSFNLTIQRQINNKTLIEVGYIGRLISNELQAININAVPYMMSQGGQQFQTAYAALETAMGCATSAAQCIQTSSAMSKGVYPTINAQPFFEAALNPSYCAGYANCTTAVLHKQATNLSLQKVWSMWSALDNGAFNFGRSMLNTPIADQTNGSNGQLSSGASISTPLGYGNYHAGFVTLKVTDYKGLTAQENFTYSKALGTGAVAQSNSIYTPDDPFNQNLGYGVQQFNQKFIFNTIVNYETQWYKSQSSLLGRAAGGWTLSAIFAAGSGTPLACGTNSTGQSFGAADAASFVDNEQCVFTSKYNGGVSTYRGVTGRTDAFGNAVGTGGSTRVNMFADPAAVFSQVRAPILGIDTKNPGYGPISGLPYWNMDLSIRKQLRVFERYNLEFSGIFSNVFNHLDFANPSMKISSPSTWGVISAQGNAPRQIQMGVRTNF